MSNNMNDGDRSVAGAISVHSVPLEDVNLDSRFENTENIGFIQFGITPALSELPQPNGDFDELPDPDDIDSSISNNSVARDQTAASPLRLTRKPLPAQLLRTSVSPRAKQQFMRFENEMLNELQADYMARTSPTRNQHRPKPSEQVIDMRLKGDKIHIGGCWGSVSLAEAIDYKPRRRQELSVINTIVAPNRGSGKRVVFEPSNIQDSLEAPKYLV